MIFGNPVAGTIHPKGWVPPAGSLDMYVIRDCADHQATGQGCALDINNGRCDGKVLASKAGRVADIDPVQGIVRIDHADLTRTAYAHMSPILVTVGQSVAQGQQIGEIGDAHDPAITNFSGCHLHFAIQLTATGPEVDPWPYMNGGDMLGIVTATPLAGGPRNFTVAPNATLNFYDPARPGKAIYSASWPAGNTLQADARCKIEWPGAGALPIPNGYPFLRCISGVYVGLMVVEQYVTLAPDPPPPTGHTDAELIKATQTAGYNAALEVSALGKTALDAAAGKYPKPA